METDLQMPALGPSVLFAATALTTMTGAVVVSGYFPRSARPAEMRAAAWDIAILTLAVATLTAGAASIALFRTTLPWYVAIILGGLAILSGPLLEQRLPLGLRTTTPGLNVIAALQVLLAWACAESAGIRF